jgi:predicted component of type VI protein secretion system
MSRYTGDVQGASQKVKGGGSRPVAFLELLESNTPMGGRIELEALEARLGRSASQADIVFKDDSTVSRIHATIVKEGNDYRLFDEQSTSGTWVNEQRVPEYGLQLVDGDTIRLGAVRLRFRQP